MISVRVKYFAEIRDMTGKKEETLLMSDGSTVKELLQKLKEIHGEIFSSRIFVSEEELKEDYNLLLNSESVEPPFSKKTLKEGDEFVILPPIAGGSLS